MYSNIQAPPFPYNPLVLQAMHAQLSRPPPTPRELIALELNMRQQKGMQITGMTTCPLRGIKRRHEVETMDPKRQCFQAPQLQNNNLQFHALPQHHLLLQNVINRQVTNQNPMHNATTLINPQLLYNRLHVPEAPSNQLPAYNGVNVNEQPVSTAQAVTLNNNRPIATRKRLNAVSTPPKNHKAAKQMKVDVTDKPSGNCHSSNVRGNITQRAVLTCSCHSFQNHNSPDLKQLDKLSLQMLERYQAQRQSNYDLQRKVRLQDALTDIIQGVIPHSSLYLVGSSLNGFGSHDSDADMCLILANRRYINQRGEAREILAVVNKALRICPFIQRPQLIRAKVPILKFKDSVSGVECDVNINNLTGVRNTFLLQAYSRLDWRVRPLVFLVKLWAGAQGINDASQSTLSSYSLTLMTLHYLQVGCSAPVIPSIQRDYPELFALHLTVDQLEANVSRVPPYKTANTQSPAELLKGMLSYYTNVFDFEEEVISVRLGVKLRKRGLQDDREWREKFISIEEPFDQSNTARAVYQYPKFELIKKAFSKGYKILQTTDNLDDLLCKCDP
ncbi:PREDICTED: LOW QUALITY PROTEIN: poly(A) RNA polymerase GLD2-like [Branchiostoma belcheri]|uniref:polynucleotide adenylyltransferase n=1 Tax=Branchiostoma belcheri TaxID=7741 RepID=A0A6P4XFJ5_BRABE|nr:PREDICTED: LOW QUALITY PROTEIN: poly(A) RNA polymerase GLD2-like [Branchiostoma belcheri]